MPSLKNGKHEKFAVLVAGGTAASVAYREAGFTCKNDATASACGTRLLKVAKVSARVDELKSAATIRAIESISITKQYVITQLLETYQQARKNENESAANQSLKLLGMEIGMFVERRRTGPLNLNDLTDEELEQLRQQFRAAIESQRTALHDGGARAEQGKAARPVGTSTH